MDSAFDATHGAGGGGGGGGSGYQYSLVGFPGGAGANYGGRAEAVAVAVQVMLSAAQARKAAPLVGAPLEDFVGGSGEVSRHRLQHSMSARIHIFGYLNLFQLVWRGHCVIEKGIVRPRLPVLPQHAGCGFQIASRINVGASLRDRQGRGFGLARIPTEGTDLRGSEKALIPIGRLITINAMALA
jgi:hypothetical protein